MIKDCTQELKLLKKINDVLLINQREEQLLNDICFNIIRYTDYKLALIFFPNVEAKLPLTPIAADGEIELLKNIDKTMSFQHFLENPMAITFLKGKTCINNHLRDSKSFIPWIQNTESCEITGFCSVPLVIKTKIKGVLIVFSASNNTIEKREKLILERIGKNVSQTLTYMRTKDLELKFSSKSIYRLNEHRIIYEVNKLLSESVFNFNYILVTAVELISKNWQFHKLCQVKITFDGVEYYSQNYAKPHFALRSQKYTFDGKLFSLEVSYKAPSLRNGKYFFSEEDELIEILADFFIFYFNQQNRKNLEEKQDTEAVSVVDQTTVGHVLLDKDLIVISYNDAMELAYPLITGRNLMPNVSFLDVLLPERRELLAKIFEHVKQTREPYKYEVKFPLGNEMQYFTTSVVPILSANGLTGYSISIYDITIIKNMVLEREKIISDLSQRNRDLEQFSYIISHNIRSPLATLLGFSNLLRQNLSEDEQNTVYNGMEDSALKLDAIIKDVNEILNVKKDLAQAKVSLNLNIVILEVLATIEDKIKETNSCIEYDFTKVNEINSISPFIHSVFYNLISNAIKYSRKNVPLQLEIWSELLDNEIKISFRDNGKGLDLDRFGDQIFGLYKRFNFETEGKGMGLFMVKTQVQALNGRINVESKIDEGSTFSITLPV